MRSRWTSYRAGRDREGSCLAATRGSQGGPAVTRTLSSGTGDSEIVFILTRIFNKSQSIPSGQSYSGQSYSGNHILVITALCRERPGSRRREKKRRRRKEGPGCSSNKCRRSGTRQCSQDRGDYRYRTVNIITIGQGDYRYRTVL